MLSRKFNKGLAEAKKKMQVAKRKQRIADWRLKDQLDVVRMSSAKKPTGERSEPKIVAPKLNQVIYDIRGYSSSRVFQRAVPLNQSRGKLTFRFNE